jgi:hypothetical protein
MSNMRKGGFLSAKASAKSGTFLINSFGLAGYDQPPIGEAGGRSLRYRRLLPCGGLGNGVTTPDRKLYRRVILRVGCH